MDCSFEPLGDRAIMIEAAAEIGPEAQIRVRLITAALEAESPAWMTGFIPAYTTVAVFYDPLALNFKEAEQELASLLSRASEDRLPEVRTVEIPVCYGGEFGPDLPFVARHNGLTEQEVIDFHTGGDYSVHMIGFAPGFPFIGGMPSEIAAPRRETPRLRIPERTVGIAGGQTGVYPIETPGGWRLIGRTPIRLFLPEQDIPSLLRAGDRIVFRQIGTEEYREMEENAHAHRP
ncbi:5-oxoprolinase subunit PxpB [Indiicoccus explosivorum]|uniref:5-oxoprolinase subunit PxpB n=1 Tax=Indiicoccus explosivorum TaxID=1917864 RepID=UPI000B447E9A|nr:5-oxoprolinase subunit PxpB [Indiicoccus explosivorum]